MNTINYIKLLYLYFSQEKKDTNSMSAKLKKELCICIMLSTMQNY